MSELLQVNGLCLKLHQFKGKPLQNNEGRPLPVLCLHGFMDHGLTFTPLLKELGWAAEAWDARGFGQSEWINSACYYHFFDYIRDLHLWVTDALQRRQASQVVLIGHSMGGMIASLYAGIYPENVHSLVNMEGWMIQNVDPATVPGRVRKWLDQCADSKDLTPFARHKSADLARGRMQRQDPKLQPEDIAFLSEPVLKQERDGFYWSHDPLHRTRSPQPFRLDQAMACWESIEASHLLLYGAESPILKLPDWDFRMQGFGVLDSQRKTTLKKLEAAGHNLHLHVPHSVSKVIQDWF